MPLTFDDPDAFLDEFVQKLRTIRFEHPLWRAIPPPNTIDVTLSHEYLRAVKAANYTVSDQMLHDYGTTDDGAERFRGPSGDYRFHGHWRAEDDLKKLRLRLRPESIVVPREVDEAEHIPTVFQLTHLVDHWMSQKEADRWPPPKVRVRCGTRRKIGRQRFSSSRKVYTHVGLSNAARIKLLNNLAVVADRCDVERGTAAWGRLTRSFASRQLCQ